MDWIEYNHATTLLKMTKVLCFEKVEQNQIEPGPMNI